jgi:prepilin-type N-terminal cleavage/methylation domain-containing protein
MKIHLKKQSEAGLSLVEVIIAIAILGVMAGGILGSFRYGFFLMQMVRENQRATQILLEKVETLRLYSWTQVNSNGFIPSTFTDVYDPQGATNGKGTVYSGTLTVSPISSATLSGCSYYTNMRQITITLQWTTRTIPRTRTLTTYIARDGLQNYVY